MKAANEGHQQRAARPSAPTDLQTEMSEEEGSEIDGPARLAKEFASERIGSRYEPRLMRLFLRSRHPLIGLRSRNDGSLARCGASSGDLRVMRL
jgi:hypothetical protein